MPVRPASERDADRLRALQSLLAEPAPELLAAALSATRETEPTAGEAVVSTAASFTLLVAVADDESVVGYILAVTGTDTHIAELVVDPDHRRQGRGRALLAAVIERGPTPVTVHVAVDNEAARGLYETVGFSTVARTDDQFDDTDGLTLRFGPGTD